MESKSPPLGALVKIQNELKNAIAAFAQHDADSQLELEKCRVETQQLKIQLSREVGNKTLLQKCEDEIFELNEKLIIESKNGEEVDRLNEELEHVKCKEKRKIELLKKELHNRADVIEKLRTDVSNGSINVLAENAVQDTTATSKALKDKTKMVKFLMKRVKVFEQAFEKCKTDHEEEMREERSKRDNLQKELENVNKLSEKNPSDEVASLKTQLAECEQKVKDVMEEKWSWVQQKNKSTEELTILLADYEEQKRSLVESESREQVLSLKLEKKREHQRSMDAEFVRRQKFHVDLLNKTKEVNANNHALNDYVIKLKTKYKNLLLFHSRDHLLHENEALRKRLDTIEVWFDDAWAGFRLEVLNFQRKLEIKDEKIEKLQAGKDGREITSGKSEFKDTDSGKFCLKAMEELSHKFQFKRRSNGYLDALKNLIIESSSLHNLKHRMDMFEDNDNDGESIEDEDLAIEDVVQKDAPGETKSIMGDGTRDESTESTSIKNESTKKRVLSKDIEKLEVSSELNVTEMKPEEDTDLVGEIDPISALQKLAESRKKRRAQKQLLESKTSRRDLPVVDSGMVEGSMVTLQQSRSEATSIGLRRNASRPSMATLKPTSSEKQVIDLAANRRNRTTMNPRRKDGSSEHCMSTISMDTLLESQQSKEVVTWKESLADSTPLFDQTEEKVTSNDAENTKDADRYTTAVTKEKVTKTSKDNEQKGSSANGKVDDSKPEGYQTPDSKIKLDRVNSVKGMGKKLPSLPWLPAATPLPRKPECSSGEPPVKPSVEIQYTATVDENVPNGGNNSLTVAEVEDISKEEDKEGMEEPLLQHKEMKFGVRFLMRRKNQVDKTADVAIVNSEESGENEMINHDKDGTLAVQPLQNKDGTLDVQPPQKPSSLLNKLRRPVTKKSVRWNNVVDGQYFEEDWVSLEGAEDFVEALKPPKEKWVVPKTSILDNPNAEKKEHDVSQLAKFGGPRLPRYTPPPVNLMANANGENITAADIFGPTNNDSSSFSQRRKTDTSFTAAGLFDPIGKNYPSLNNVGFKNETKSATPDIFSLTKNTAGGNNETRMRTPDIFSPSNKTGRKNKSRVTAADIFGPIEASGGDMEEEENLLDEGNLDDAMDFLLNM